MKRQFKAQANQKMQEHRALKSKKDGIKNVFKQKVNTDDIPRLNTIPK